MRPPVGTIYAESENLVEAFGENRFDVVHSRNALDHVFDPARSVREMLAVCKPGGAVFFQGHTNEGVTEGYQGYHQWNFLWEDDEFIIWRPFSRMRLSDICPGHRIRQVPPVKGDPSADPGKWYKVLIEKSA